ncbi:helix-turn-helix transcriptional regulator [Phytohabitans sp. ZYX-F-186]|uniref:Helix-turn-helix transcriptional regulator n=1 Tax=Phytohabitans maris TaxID=3071409 RepID=A0ABU0Z7R0_9ACTN|nr:helix-turn-helix transcriptional regulator [Phytohabitans sp. ZYX-F-186]MDQ7903090.1 helix-turn-helix transcriptional regulator [Phytohabitans sp. ZYX-F-186]
MTSTKRGPDQTLGQYLESARQEAGYSLRQLAGISGLAMSSVNRLLKDEVEQPSPEHLTALARALELNATDLFLLAGLPIPEQAASLDIMLRKGYGVSDDELPALKREIEALIAKHTDRPDRHHTRKKGGNNE